MQGKDYKIFLIRWIAHQYHNISRLYERRYPFKIVDTKIEKGSNEFKFIIQIEHKISTLDKTAKELMQDQKFLEGFSSQDIQMISFQYFLENSKAEFNLIGEKRNETGFSLVLKNRKLNAIQIQNISDYKNMKKLVSKTDSQSAFRIGYLLGSLFRKNKKYDK